MWARRQQVARDRINAWPWWGPWCLAAVGLALDWRCAFEWFNGTNRFYSELVLGRTALIALACAGVALLAVARVTGVSRWRPVSMIFFAVSLILYDVLSTHWDVQRLIARH